MTEPTAMPDTGRLAEVLLVEDNPTDLLLLKLLFMEEQRLRFDLHHASDGEEALAWLRQKRDAGERLPDLILLDVHMPRLDGFAVLEILSAEHALARIPVVMLSASIVPRELNEAIRFGAGHMTKPATIAQLEAALRYVPQLQLVRESGEYQLRAG